MNLVNQGGAHLSCTVLPSWLTDPFLLRSDRSLRGHRRHRFEHSSEHLQRVVDGRSHVTRTGGVWQQELRWRQNMPQPRTPPPLWSGARLRHRRRLPEPLCADRWVVCTKISALKSSKHSRVGCLPAFSSMCPGTSRIRCSNPHVQNFFNAFLY